MHVACGLSGENPRPPRAHGLVWSALPRGSIDISPAPAYNEAENDRAFPLGHRRPGTARKGEMRVNFGNNAQSLAERRVLHEGDVELSERAFNGVIGGLLLWGFLLNYLTVVFWGDTIVRTLSGRPIAFFIAYLVLAIAGGVLIARPSPALSLVGYHMICVPLGITLCLALQGTANADVRAAILMTAIITLSFMIAGQLFPGFFLKLGRVLLFGLGVMIVGQLVCLFLFPRVSFAWTGAALFGFYIGYDWARANTCARTLDNAIDLAANLYLDIINLLLRVLEIMSRKKD